MGLEIVSSLPLQCQIDDRAYFTDCAVWAGTYFGGASNILSVDIHRDEAAPHCHILLLPIRDGRMVGSEMMGNRKVLTATQSNFCAMVASRYGLRKAPARLSRTTKLTAAREVMQRLQKTSDAAMSSQVWPLLRTAIENDPGPFLTYLGIELKAPPKRQKTMTEIFIGKGKGKAKEANPLDFTAPPGSRRLCSVGFAPEPPPFTATNPGDQESSGVNRPYPESLEPALEFAFEGVAGSVAGAVDGLVQDSSNGKCRGQDNVGGQDHDTKPITGHPQS